MTTQNTAKNPGTDDRFGPNNTASQLMLAAPVFLFYQLGLLISPKAANGVDVFTRALGYLVGLSWFAYLIVMIGLIAIYGLVLHRMMDQKRFGSMRISMVVLESAVYALLMGPVAGLLLSKLHVLGSPVRHMGLLDRVVASAGAGFYEELVFRLLGLGGTIWLLKQRGWQPIPSLLVGILLTSVVFSGVHYIGSQSDPFELTSFAYRAVLGGFLAMIYVFRGFSTAVYAHTLYDIYVMVILMPL